MLPLRFNLTANETDRQPRVGRRVYVKSVTGEIKVTCYSSGGVIVGQANMVQGNRMTAAADFTLLEVEDVSGSANSIDLLAGLGDFDEAGLGTIDSITNEVATVDEWPAGVNVFSVAAGVSSNPYNAASQPNGVQILAASCFNDNAAAAADMTRVYLDFGGDDIELCRAEGPSSADQLTRVLTIREPHIGIVDTNGASSGEATIVWRGL